MQRKIELLTATILLLLIFWNIQDHVFFWDTIQLGAKHALYFFNTNFHSLILPSSIDSGHPPLLGLFLALGWKLFGQSLVVSHWLMFPFVWGIMYLLFRLGDVFIGKELAFFMVLIGMIDPVLAGQSILISPDLILVFGFLLGWDGILQNKKGLLIIAAILLACTSTRGMMVVVVLFLVDILENRMAGRPLSLPVLFKISLTYVPAGLLAFSFLLYHYLQTGWIGYHADSPWAPGFEKVNLRGFFKNVMVLGWRLLDFGRLILWGVLIVFFIKKWPFWKSLDPAQKRVGGMFLSSLLLLSITFLIYSKLQGHRYLLPVFISFNFVFMVWIKSIVQTKKKQVLIYLLALGAYIFGNTWIYPDKISQGWDSTLAHWPYYEQRGNMLEYLEKADIELYEIGTAFPEIGPLHFKDLSGDLSEMKEQDLSKDSYILYSNIMNDFSDEQIDTLRNHWKVLKKFENKGIKVILYGKEK